VLVEFHSILRTRATSTNAKRIKEMPYKDFEADDPMELKAVVLPADAEASRDMAYVFAEEFARLGYDRARLLWLFQNPFYAGAHGAYRALGEKETLSIIDECLNVWENIRVRVQDVQAVPTDQARDAGED
jgi:hypothetical protein